MRHTKDELLTPCSLFLLILKACLEGNENNKLWGFIHHAVSGEFCFIHSFGGFAGFINSRPAAEFLLLHIICLVNCSQPEQLTHQSHSASYPSLQDTSSLAFRAMDHATAHHSRRAAPIRDVPAYVWASPEEQEYERYVKARDGLKRLAPLSEVVPSTWGEWLAQRVAVLEAKMREARASIRFRRVLVSSNSAVPEPSRLSFSDSLGGVLAMPTVWSTGPQEGGRRTAGWPGQQELKWDGDDRAKSNYHRFPPVPRELGNGTVAWHHMRALPTHEFDRVWPVPTAEDIAWTRVVNEDMPESLVLSELWEAIDSPI